MAEVVVVPDYQGGSLVNLIAELEHRLSGNAVSPRLHPELGRLVPEADSYVLVIFDGLGAGQLSHPSASMLASSRVADLDAPFPTTTTVSLSTIASGEAPSRHGVLGYQLWMPQLEVVVNTIKWTTLWGAPVEVDTSTMLPSPNLWERLKASGVEPITVQPRGFEGSPLTRLLYRGCRFEPVDSMHDMVTATAQLAAVPYRLVVAYVPQVDFAAHVYGQMSAEYGEAVSTADTVWSALSSALPPGVAMVGTADHGHVDFPADRQIRLPRAAQNDLVLYGDGRAMLVRGDASGLADELPARWLPWSEMAHWWGPEPRSNAFEDRRPDGALVADDGWLLLHRHSDDRMIGNHGGLSDAERRIPLLVSG